MGVSGRKIGNEEFGSLEEEGERRRIEGRECGGERGEEEGISGESF